MPRPRPAFTLIEVMLVVVILGIMTALAVPRMNVERFRADADVQGIRTALQQAQRLSLIRQNDIAVVFDTAAGAIRVIEDRNRNKKIDTGEPVSRRGLTEGARFAAPVKRLGGGTTSAKLVGADLTKIDNMPALIFRRDGSASSDCELYFQSGRAPRLEYRAVTITRSTGRVDWYRGNSTGAWKAGGI